MKNKELDENSVIRNFRITAGEQGEGAMIK